MKKIFILFLIFWLVSVIPAQAVTNTGSTYLRKADSDFWSITANSSNKLSITGSMTITAWVNNVALPNNTDRTVVCKSGATNQTAYFFNVTDDAGTEKLQWLNSDDGTTANSVNLLANQGWTASTTYFIAVAYNTSAATATLYVNGNSIGSGASDTSIASTTASVRVGSCEDIGDKFDGWIDDVRIWSRELGNAEIQDIYANPCTANNGASLQAWYLFETDGTDSSSNGYNLTSNNSPTAITDTAYADCPVVAGVGDGGSRNIIWW